uniref:Uncharacterized protein n=1 Tax=Steinernema glaseri TaxID=37863 RepID=A0A1I7XZ12_9BILA
MNVVQAWRRNPQGTKAQNTSNLFSPSFFVHLAPKLSICNSSRRTAARGNRQGGFYVERRATRRRPRNNKYEKKRRRSQRAHFVCLIEATNCKTDEGDRRRRIRSPPGDRWARGGVADRSDSTAAAVCLSVCAVSLCCLFLRAASVTILL